MTDVSRLELTTRIILSLPRRTSSTAWGEPMLARAIGRLSEADPQFQQSFLAALADALMGRDELCSIRLERTGKRGRPENGRRGRAWALAQDVRDRCDKAKLGPAAESQASVLKEYMDLHGLELRQAKDDLKEGQKELAALHDQARKRRGALKS